MTPQCQGCRAKSHHPADEACNGCPCFNEGFREGVRRLDNLRREQRTRPAAPEAETDANGLTEVIAAARRGPWEAVQSREGLGYFDVLGPGDSIVAEMVVPVNAEAIVAAVNALPALLADLDATRERVRVVEAAHEAEKADHERLRAGVEALPELTQGPLRVGTALWPECDRDAYSLAIEEAQSALRALLAGGGAR